MNKLYYDDFMLFLEEGVDCISNLIKDEDIDKEHGFIRLEGMKITKRIIDGLYKDFENRYKDSNRTVYDEFVANQILNTLSSYANIMYMSDKKETEYSLRIRKELRSIVNNLWIVHHEVDELGLYS